VLERHPLNFDDREGRIVEEEGSRDLEIWGRRFRGQQPGKGGAIGAHGGAQAGDGH
jgi:hypothetical protein